MNISVTQVPIWLSILFVITFSIVPVFLIANTVKSVLQKKNEVLAFKISEKIKFFYWVYFMIIAGVSLTGFFAENTFPPRIILFAVIPLFIFYIFFIQKKNWFQQVLKDITLQQLVFIHVFRFVGVFFLLVYMYDALPKQFAFVGGLGDIITAVLVFPVILALKKKKTYAKSLVWIWNFIGILDISCVITTAILITQKAIENNETGVAQFGTFPFSWIPAFAPATIIFLHILVFKKLKS